MSDGNNRYMTGKNGKIGTGKNYLFIPLPPSA
jgi:hypothetical protein